MRINLLRTVFAAALYFTILGLASPMAHAQAHSSRPIRMTVPSTPGGASLIAEKLGQRWGQLCSAKTRSRQRGLQRVLVMQPAQTDLTRTASGALIRCRMHG